MKKQPELFAASEVRTARKKGRFSAVEASALNQLAKEQQNALLVPKRENKGFLDLPLFQDNSQASLF